MNEWIEGYKKFHSELSVNDTHISDLISDTKSEKVLQYTGDNIKENFDGIYTYETLEKLPKEQIPEVLGEIYLSSERFVLSDTPWYISFRYSVLVLIGFAESCASLGIVAR